MFGAEIFAEFAVGCGAVADAGACLKRIKAAPVETAKPQVAAQKEEEPVSRFFRFLRSAINANSSGPVANQDDLPAIASSKTLRRDRDRSWPAPP